MAYTITNSRGQSLGAGTIADGTVDNSATSLTLIGRNYSNYGQIMVDNLVKLVENFAKSAEPVNPLEGQLWWDTTNSTLKVYTGSLFKVISACTAQSSAPSGPTVGDLWWDTANAQLYVYDGATTGWILVGPGYSKVNGKSGAIWEEINDTLNSPHSVVSVYIDGTRIGIVSADSEFTPNVAISGFSTIKPGYNMATSGQFEGTANNASRLGGVVAANYMRTDINNVITGNISILNNDGVRIGVNQTLALNMVGTEAAVVNVSGGNVGLWANVGGTLTRAIYVDGASGEVSLYAGPQTSLGVASKGYVDNKFINADLTNGVATALTAPVGTANLWVATTEFVTNGLSGLLRYKIYDNDTHMWINDAAGTANIVINGTTVLSALSSGVSLVSGSSAATQPQTYNGSGNLTIATTQYVKTATQWWGGSAKFVSTNAPNVNQGNDGDFWFQREV